MKTETHCCRCCMAEDAVSLASLDHHDLTDEQKELSDLAMRFLKRRYTEAIMPRTEGWPGQGFAPSDPRSTNVSGTCDT